MYSGRASNHSTWYIYIQNRTRTLLCRLNTRYFFSQPVTLLLRGSTALQQTRSKRFSYSSSLRLLSGGNFGIVSNVNFRQRSKLFTTHSPAGMSSVALEIWYRIILFYFETIRTIRTVRTEVSRAASLTLTRWDTREQRQRTQYKRDDTISSPQELYTHLRKSLPEIRLRTRISGSMHLSVPLYIVHCNRYTRARIQKG